MKILRVISSINPENGGPINGLVNSSEILVKKDHTINVLSLDDPQADYVKEFPFPVTCFKGSFGVLQYNKDFQLWLYENVANFDVVIIHGLWQFHGFATYKACIKASVPYVLFSHGMLDPWFNKISKLKTLKKNIYWRFFEGAVVNNATKVLFTSEEEKILARTSFQPYAVKEQVVAYGSPLPTVDIPSSAVKFLDNIPHLKDKKFGLFLSRIHSKKGIDILIEAFDRFSDTQPDFHLVIAGPDTHQLKEKLMKNCSVGISDRIHWVGMLKGEMKWGAFHLAEFFILPSHQENFGIVVAEALSTFTPTLITNKVNIWREIDSAGFVENDNVLGIERLLSRWFALTEVEKNEMGKKAHLCYQKNFSMEAAVDSLEKTLVSIVQT
tara:strand:- start:20480 stop:21628 length:1149 start_codon:yes stop_codon:yes gene_type:complete